MSDKGIDYGMGTTNIDHASGIRYGVIHQNDILQTWCDESESDYGAPTCPKCGNDVEDWGEAKHGEYKHGTGHGCDDYACESCKLSWESGDCYGDEPIAHVLDDGEYLATQGGDDCDIFVTKAPYFTRAQFCSPCAPGACHLGEPTDDGERCYCFGHDWFEDGKAPYPVYSVATGELVPPPAK